MISPYRLFLVLAVGIVWANARPAPAQDLDAARALFAAGRLPEAAQAFRAAAAAAASDPAEAALAHNNACVVLNRLADYRAALPQCEKALALRRQLDEPRRLGRTLNNLGLVLQNLGDYDAADRYYREALDLNRQLGDAEGEAVNRANLGAVAILAGRYREALAEIAAGIELAAAHAGEPWSAERMLAARINQGVVLEKLGAFREALELFQEMLATNDEIDPQRRATIAVNMGTLYRNLGDPVAAEAAYRQAAATFETLGDLSGLSNARLNLGIALHLNLDRLADAETAYRQALANARQSGDRGEEIQDLFYLGRLLVETGRLDDAVAAFTACLEASRTSGSAEGRWSALDGLGRVAAARGHLDDALELLHQAIDEIEAQRARLAAGALRSGYFGDKRAVYSAAVRVLASLDRQRPAEGFAAQALDLVERAKARELIEALGASSARPATATELRQRVDDGLLLEYFAAGDKLFVWIVDARRLTMLDLGSASAIVARIGRLHRLLEAGDEPPAALLAELSRALLAPVGPLPERLWLAPDGLLHYLPFDLLPDPAQPQQPLVERTAISYLPSGSALAALGQRSETLAVTIAGFADPRLPRQEQGAVLDPGALWVSRFALEPLPAAAEELAAIARQLPRPHLLHTGDDATEDAFRRAVASGASVVHLATHTVVDERPGRGAAILLTAAGSDDGLLEPHEIANLDYRAELTVLAGCSTALGADDDGRALASLTGAFLAAGSAAVVATLWDVGDDATAVFMEQLYHQLQRGHVPAEALRRAKLRLRRDPRWNRPALWAAYVIVGEAPDPLRRRLPRLSWIWLSTGLLVVVLLLRWLRTR